MFRLLIYLCSKIYNKKCWVIPWVKETSGNYLRIWIIVIESSKKDSIRIYDRKKRIFIYKFNLLWWNNYLYYNIPKKHDYRSLLWGTFWRLVKWMSKPLGVLPRVYNHTSRELINPFYKTYDKTSKAGSTSATAADTPTNSTCKGIVCDQIPLAGFFVYFMLAFW